MDGLLEEVEQNSLVIIITFCLMTDSIPHHALWCHQNLMYSAVSRIRPRGICYPSIAARATDLVTRLIWTFDSVTDSNSQSHGLAFHAKLVNEPNYVKLLFFNVSGERIPVIRVVDIIAQILIHNLKQFFLLVSCLYYFENYLFPKLITISCIQNMIRYMNYLTLIWQR